MGKRPHYSSEDIAQQLQHVYNDGASFGDSLVQLGPVLRAVNASQQHQSYLAHIKEFTTGKEKEIEQLCKANYQDFIASTNKLLKVRQGTTSLKHRVAELNDDIQAKGGDMAAKKRDLLDNRRVGQNIDDSVDVLQASLRVLDVSAKITELIRQKKYYPALRLLHDLQHVHLQGMLHLAFARHLLVSIPNSISQIRSTVTKEMKSWLFAAREASRNIGRLTLEAMLLRSRRWTARKAKDVDGTLRTARINGSVELAFSERHDVNVLDSEHADLEFKPLYQSVLVHDLLGVREEAQQSFSDDRRAQAALLLSSASLDPLTVSACDALLEETAGFFVIESHVLKTTNGFRPEQEVDDLWESMTSRIVSLMTIGFSTCKDVDIFLAAKLKLGNFLQAMGSFGYDVSPLHVFLDSLPSEFAQIMERKYSQEFEQIIDEDENQAMVVNDHEDFDRVVSVSWLPADGPWSETTLRSSDFPLSLPFSSSYPLCCIDVRNFIDQYSRFMDEVSGHGPAFASLIAETLDRLLAERISLKIRGKLKNTNNLSQLAPLAINLLFFQTACREIGDLLASMSSDLCLRGSVYLKAVKSFGGTIDFARARMEEQVWLKLDSFFGMSEYQWTNARALPASTEEPSTYLMEMVNYLTLVLDSILANLSIELKAFLYRSALQHCADRMMEYLTSSEPSQINDLGLAAFATDIRFVVQHAANVPFGRMDDVFEELSQMVGLLQSDTISDFLDPDSRMLAFPAVQGNQLKFALIKLVSYYHSASSRSSTQIDFRRKKDMEYVLHELDHLN